jgi:hypothetical protein
MQLTRRLNRPLKLQTYGIATVEYYVETGWCEGQPIKMESHCMIERSNGPSMISTITAVEVYQAFGRFDIGLLLQRDAERLYSKWFTFYLVFTGADCMAWL